MLSSEGTGIKRIMQKEAVDKQGIVPKIQQKTTGKEHHHGTSGTPLDMKGQNSIKHQIFLQGKTCRAKHERLWCGIPQHQ
jgi:hypothetical protein